VNKILKLSLGARAGGRLLRPTRHKKRKLNRRKRKLLPIKRFLQLLHVSRNKPSAI
jgi:hypothetical protein